MAETANLSDEIRDYLLFTGYEVSRGEHGGYIANHPTQFKVGFHEFRGGVLLYSAFIAKPDATEENLSFMRFINGLNSKAAVGRFYYDDGTLVVEGWFGGTYHSAIFGRFFDLWKEDLAANLERQMGVGKEFLE